MTVPYWVQDAVFYQIFPDRFANGDPSNDPPNKLPWGASPTIDGFQGGDLRGVIQHFNYLLDLGVTALYFNPIFQATSTHRYNTTDYYRIDPKLGDLRDFRALLEVAHSNGVRVILDGVFNHCGRGFFAFNDVVENGAHSPYRDWFHIHKFPLDAYTPGDAKNYAAWWKHKSLPKLDTSNPEARQYIFGVARHWIEQGADGWRLDVPNEIDDDAFWAEFRHVVTTANPDAYLLGEIWDGDPRWVGESHFDGLMNYPVREAVLQLLQTGSLTPTAFGDRVGRQLTRYPLENAYAMYNPLGSHDTERLLTLFDLHVDKARLAFLFLFAYPGAPAIYYGDEIGLQGGKDPDCRRAFPWDETCWNTGLRDWVKRLASARKKFVALRRGAYQQLYADNRRQGYAFSRKLGDQAVVVALNPSNIHRHLLIDVASVGWPDGRIVKNLLGKEEYFVSGDTLNITLPPWGGAYLGNE